MICGPRAAPGDSRPIGVPIEIRQKEGLERTIRMLRAPDDQTEVTMAEELELNSTQVEHEYGGSEIQVLEGLERCGSVRECTSAPPRSPACTIWCMRSWTTPSMRLWPATAPTLR